MDDIQDLPEGTLPQRKSDRNGDAIEYKYIEYPDMKEREDEGKAIMAKLNKAQDRLSAYYRECKHIQEVYINKRSGDSEAPKWKIYNNVIFSIVNTIKSRILVNLPQAEVSYRGNKPGSQDIAYKQYTDMLEKTINSEINTAKFDAVLNTFVNNIVKYDMGIIRILYTPLEKQLEYDLKANKMPTDSVAFKTLHWDEFLHSGERHQDQWSWVAFKREITKDKMELLLDPQMKDEGMFPPVDRPDAEDMDQDYDEEWHNNVENFVVWEFWDKANRVVYFVREHDQLVIGRYEDPLQLDTFFPISDQVTFLGKDGTSDYRCLYYIIKDNQERLDEMSHTSRALTRAAIPKMLPLFKLEEEVKKWFANNNLVAQPSKDLANKFRDNPNFNAANAIFVWPVHEFAQANDLIVQESMRLKQEMLDMIGLSDVFMGQNTNGKDGVQTQILKDVQGNNSLKPLQRKVIWAITTILEHLVDIIRTHYATDTIETKSANPIPKQQDPQTGKMIPVNPDDTALWEVMDDDDGSQQFDVEIEPQSMALVDQQINNENISTAMGLLAQLEAELVNIPPFEPEKAIRKINIYSALIDYQKLPVNISTKINEQFASMLEEFQELADIMAQEENNPQIDPNTGEPMPSTRDALKEGAKAEAMQSDPAFMKEQNNMQIEQGKQQNEEAENQRNHEREMFKLETERMKAQADIGVKEDQNAIDEQKANDDFNIKSEQNQITREKNAQEERLENERLKIAKMTKKEGDVKEVDLED